MAYISRDKLNEAFTALRFNEDGTLRHWDDRPNWCMSGQEVEDLINSIPIADVVEKERYDRLLENANILAEAVRKYQTADVPERNVGKWIPVTEQLPKKYIGEWLCCDKYGDIYILRYENIYPNGNCVFCYTDYDGYSVHVDDIVAWMPLPESYRGE